jgi:hypothetical protein
MITPIYKVLAPLFSDNFNEVLADVANAMDVDVRPLAYVGYGVQDLFALKKYNGLLILPGERTIDRAEGKEEVQFDLYFALQESDAQGLAISQCIYSDALVEFIGQYWDLDGSCFDTTIDGAIDHLSPVEGNKLIGLVVARIRCIVDASKNHRAIGG